MSQSSITIDGEEITANAATVLLIWGSVKSELEDLEVLGGTQDTINTGRRRVVTVSHTKAGRNVTSLISLHRSSTITARLTDDGTVPTEIFESFQRSYQEFLTRSQFTLIDLGQP
ncbi:hypothetical protein ODZ83_05425 [Acaricomes phytoseiuli]|uniref:hypothetical protein n=1 Tax=Acaricomes phytoseiuli TaxID=291968 RepID=UPI0022230522|nr:hypothetical protein [Acaricomes phytoseiuli]MCW1249631.1 hypothetical protein [Acaricomes phytoseiuli]